MTNPGLAGYADDIQHTARPKAKQQYQSSQHQNQNHSQFTAAQSNCFANVGMPYRAKEGPSIDTQEIARSYNNSDQRCQSRAGMRG